MYSTYLKKKSLSLRKICLTKYKVKLNAIQLVQSHIIPILYCGR